MAYCGSTFLIVTTKFLVQAQLQLRGQEGLCRQTEGASLANKDFMAPTVRATEVKQGQSNPGLVFPCQQPVLTGGTRSPGWVAPAFPQLAEQSRVQGGAGVGGTCEEISSLCYAPCPCLESHCAEQADREHLLWWQTHSQSDPTAPSKAMAPAFAIPLLIQHGERSLAECCILKQELASTHTSWLPKPAQLNQKPLSLLLAKVGTGHTHQPSFLKPSHQPDGLLCAQST